MALVPKYHHMYGVSGRFGDIVYRTTRKGKTIASYYPKAKAREIARARKPDPTQTRFAAAVDYACAEMATAEGKAYYDKNRGGAGSAYHAAISDYCTMPKVRMVSARAGKRGTRIVLETSGVIHCCALYNTSDTTYSHNAKSKGGRYTITVPHGVREVKITACDRPGNEVTEVVYVREMQVPSGPGERRQRFEDAPQVCQGHIEPVSAVPT